MRRLGTIPMVVALGLVCLMVGSSAVIAGQFEGKATPKKMNGTWSSVVVVPPNDILGNTEDMPLPELDTFSASGTVVTSAGATVLPLTLDSEEDSYLASVGLGQGNWKFIGNHRFVMTQWRFLTDLNTGEPFGYIKVLAEWRLESKHQAIGEYEVQILELDMRTPYYSNGDPVRVSGPFFMQRLPIERLP
jgi:hypothetical protein